MSATNQYQLHLANNIPFGSFQCSLEGVKTRPQVYTIYKVPLEEVPRGMAQERNENNLTCAIMNTTHCIKYLQLIQYLVYMLTFVELRLLRRYIVIRT